MDIVYVKINPEANQFWDPSNKKQKMLVGRGVFEVENTAEIQRGLANSALIKSSKEEFDKQKESVKEEPTKEEAQKADNSKTEESVKDPAKTSSKTTKK